MTEMLKLAGAPVRAIALIPEALRLCLECRRHQRLLAKPHVSMRFVTVFNYEVYLDLLFFDDWIFMLMMDGFLRFCRFGYVTHKTFEALEKCFRRWWISLFGAPRKVIMDKERALATDRFGIWCEHKGSPVNYTLPAQTTRSLQH